MILGALEAGGTKMVCSVGDEHCNVLDRYSLPRAYWAYGFPRVAEAVRNRTAPVI